MSFKVDGWAHGRVFGARMYEDYYGLSDRPFQLISDARYFFASKPHANGLDYLEYGLSKGEGFVVVTGEIGAGKTTLVNHLRDQVSTERVLGGRIVVTCVDADDLLRLVAGAFDIPVEDPALTKAILLQRFEEFLERCGQEGKKACLIIDEAQGLSDAALEELRMLSNIQAGPKPVLQIILLGQPELQHRLLAEPLEQLRQRVIASCHLSAFDACNTRDYIAHRLTVAGWRGEPSFSEGALHRIHGETGGIPRKINLLCDRLLLYGFLSEKRHLDADDVRAVIEDLRGEGLYTPSPAARDADSEARPELEPIGISPDLPESGPVRLVQEDAQSTEPSPSDDEMSADTHPSTSLPDTTGQIKRLGLGDSASQLSLSPQPVSTPKPARKTEQDDIERAEPVADENASFGKPRPIASRHRTIDAWEDELEPRAPRRGALPMAILLFVAAFALTYLALNWYWGDLPGVVTSVETPLPTQILEVLRPRAAPLESAPLSLARPEQTQAEVADDTEATSPAEPATPTLTRETTEASTSEPQAALGPAPKAEPSAKQIAGEPQTKPEDGQPVAELRDPSAQSEDMEPPPLAQDLPAPVEHIQASPDESNLAEAHAASETQQTAAGHAEPTLAPQQLPAEPAKDVPATPPEESMITVQTATDGRAESQTGGSAQDAKADRTAAPQEARTATPLTTEQEPAPSDVVALKAPLARAQLTSQIRSREPVDNLHSPISAAELPNRRLYFFTEVVGFSGRAVVHRWTYKGRPVQALPFSIGGDRWRVYSAKSIGDNTGPWQVIVADDQGNILKTTDFIIE
jgi:general secretion pathway protein A